MAFVANFKNVLRQLLPRRVVVFLQNRKSLVHIPYNRKSVISDLFPFKIMEGWETYFELLNIPMLINPEGAIGRSYIVKLIFFDQNGTPFHEYKITMDGIVRQTIILNEILRSRCLTGLGTFACFHEVYLSELDRNEGFLAERGYVGFSNKAISKMKGYVHGNLDALALSNKGKVRCLGKSFHFNIKEFRLQHLLEGPATYEMCFVNTSVSGESLTLEILSRDNAVVKKERRFIPSKGITCFSVKIMRNEPRRVIIYSKLNLPRPVIFRIEEGSFDVFHG